MVFIVKLIRAAVYRLTCPPLMLRSDVVCSRVRPSALLPGPHHDRQQIQQRFESKFMQTRKRIKKALDASRLSGDRLHRLLVAPSPGVRSGRHELRSRSGRKGAEHAGKKEP